MIISIIAMAIVKLIIFPFIPWTEIRPLFMSKNNASECDNETSQNPQKINTVPPYHSSVRGLFSTAPRKSA